MEQQNIVKIGRAEFTQDEAFALYESGKYLVASTRIYQIFYSAAQKRVYGQIIYRMPKGHRFCAPGRFYAMDAETINYILGFNLLAE